MTLKITDIVFRDARIEEAEEIANLIHCSAIARFDYLFATDKITPTGFLKNAFVKPTGFYSYTNHMIVMHENNIVGVISIFKCSKGARYCIDTFLLLMKCYGLAQAIGVIRRMNKASGALAPLTSRSAYGDNLCISHSMRGNGMSVTKMKHTVKINIIQ